MKKLILVGVALLLVFSVIPAMAGDNSSVGKEPVKFQALSKMPAPQHKALKSMTDKELAAIEGKGCNLGNFICNSINNATVTQANVCAGCVGVIQNNSSSVNQN